MVILIVPIYVYIYKHISSPPRRKTGVSAKRCAYILTSITIISRQPKASETLRKIETHEYST